MEVECFLPQSKVQELGITIGSYRHGHPLPAPLPQACPGLTQAMWGSLLRPVGHLLEAYRVPITRVVGHRERPSGRAQGKTCPGFDVAIMRNLLRKEV